MRSRYKLSPHIFSSTSYLPVLAKNCGLNTLLEVVVFFGNIEIKTAFSLEVARPSKIFSNYCLYSRIVVWHYFTQGLL